MNVGKVNAYTKNGNPYNKTSVGKKVGTLAALGFGTYFNYKCLKVFTIDGTPMRKVVKEVAKNFPLNITYARSIAAFGIAGLAVGAVVDWVVNKVRKHKADKAAAAQNAQ